MSEVCLSIIHWYVAFLMLQNIKNIIQIYFSTVEGDSGMMGGSVSHEFHYPCGAGEEKLVECNNCQLAVNASLLKNSVSSCPKCNSPDISTVPGIEVRL